MYPKTTLESVQKYSLLMGIPSSRLNNNDTLTDNVAAISSSHVIEIYFKGLTLDFPISKHNEFSLDHFPVLSKRIVHSLLLKHPKSGEWNFSLSLETLLALCILKLLGFPRLVTWTFIPPNPLLLHQTQFHPILILVD